jgi:hypothetical protein
VQATIYGIDFTSSPRRAKAITVARATLDNNALWISGVARFESFDAFEVFLQTPGPWVGAFDFPFGLPRELVMALAWPSDWHLLVEHVRMLGKVQFKQSLDRARQSRPVGAKYIERKGDRLAGSSSPMKLVNPPVGLMFFEGAWRLARAGVSVVPCAPNSDTRIALEAYPGFLARQITRESYKKDGPEGGATKRVAARNTLVQALPAFAKKQYALSLTIDAPLVRECVSDGSGDTLDAVLCAVQAAVGQIAFDNGDARYGIPNCANDFEGWIVTVENR